VGLKVGAVEPEPEPVAAGPDGPAVVFEPLPDVPLPDEPGPLPAPVA
jgi:hypothetical protein